MKHLFVYIIVFVTTTLANGQISPPVPSQVNSGNPAAKNMEDEQIKSTMERQQRSMLSAIPQLEVEGTMMADTFSGDGSKLTNLSISGSPIANVIVVAKSGGDFTSIMAAINSIADHSAENRYQILVGPGIYSENINMKKFVDIVGSGPNLTHITFGGGGANSTVNTADSAELKDLSVENNGTGSSSFALCINNYRTAPSITNVIAHSYGGSFNYTIYSTDEAHPVLRNVTAIAGEGSSAVGHYHFNSNSTNYDCHYIAIDDTNDNGIYCTYGGSSEYTIILKNSTLESNIRKMRLANSYQMIMANTQLVGEGTVDLNGGSLACAFCYDKNGLQLDGSCQ